MNNKKNILQFLMAFIAFAFVIPGCGGGSSGSGNSSTGSTLTLSGLQDTSVSGLVYNSTISNAGSGATSGIYTIYLREWHNATAVGVAAMIYYDGGTSEQYLSFDVTANANSAPSVWYYAGAAPSTTNTPVYCHVSGNTVSYPTCTSIGMSVNRATGTLSFTATPSYNPANLTTGTMSGSLTFAAF